MTEPGRDPGWLRRWWLFYTVLIALAFAVPETVGIISSGEGGTFTESIQGWLGTGDGAVSVGWVTLTVLLVGFVVWFPLHIKGGVWPWEKRRE